MTIPLEAVLSDRYFDLDPDIYGAFALEAKIIDTVGAPSTSTALANLLHSTTGHSQTLTVSPNLNSQGTYDMSYNFAIQQDNDLTGLQAHFRIETASLQQTIRHRRQSMLQRLDR